MLSIERDLKHSSYNLRDLHDAIEMGYFTNVLKHGGNEINIISIYSNFEGELLIYVDGREHGKLFIGKGVENISLNIAFNEGINCYVMPFSAQNEQYNCSVHVL